MGFGSALGAGVKSFKKRSDDREKKVEEAEKERRNKIVAPKGMFTGHTAEEVGNSETAPTITYDPMSADMSDPELLDAIARNEGTYKTGYNTEYAYGKYGGDRDVALEDMTVDEVLAHQDTMLANQGGRKLKSTAIGRYQMLQQTLRDEMKHGDISGDTKFTNELQDKMIMQRLRRMRKYDDWKTGAIDSKTFEHNLSKEFASIQNPLTGKGYYPGQGSKPLKYKRNEVTMPTATTDPYADGDYYDYYTDENGKEVVLNDGYGPTGRA